MLSDVIESLCLGINEPFEVISSEEMLAVITQFNGEIRERTREEPDYDWRDEFLLLGTDVVSLFPSLSAEKTGYAVRKQVEKSEIIWSEIDYE